MKARVKKFFIYLVAAAVLMVGGTVGLIEFTNRPDFCRSCHYMEPYYDAWAASTHKDVPCDLCHYPPGYDNMIKGKIHDINQLVKYATNAYRKSKPWAEIQDASCLREGCHDTRLLEGTVMFGNVKFDHKPHLTEMRRGRQLRCTSCHSQIVQGDHMTVTPSTCVLCHFKETETETGRKTDDCRLCHDPSTEPTSVTQEGYDHTRVVQDSLDCRRCHGDMVVGDGAVREQSCYFCHWDQDRLAKFNDSELMHKKHITEHKIECEQCHLSMEHKWNSAENAASHCDGCHVGMHQNQLSLFSGHGGQGVEDHPNPMYNISMSCQGCHVSHDITIDNNGRGETMTATGKSCEPCHGKGYDRLVKQWDDIIQNKVNYLGRLAGKVDKAFASTKTISRVDIDMLNDARANLDIVKYGKPVHNIVYSNELLFAAFDDLGRVAKDLGLFVETTDLFEVKTMVPSDCRNCHATVDNITVEVNGKMFSHSTHLSNGKTCSNCHTHQRRHGQTYTVVNDCQSCHHKSDNCEKCHSLQATSYNGGKFNGFEFEPSIMAEAEVGCLDCHGGDDGKIVRPANDQCADCHDDDYIDLGIEWQQDVQNKIAALDVVMEKIKTLSLTNRQQQDFAHDLESIDLIRKDKSLGIHNNEEIIAIIDRFIARYESWMSGS